MKIFTNRIEYNPNSDLYEINTLYIMFHYSFKNSITLINVDSSFKLKLENCVTAIRKLVKFDFV